MVVLITNRFAALNPRESPHPQLLAKAFPPDPATARCGSTRFQCDKFSLTNRSLVQLAIVQCHPQHSNPLFVLQVPSD